MLAHIEGDLAGPRSVRGVRSRHGRCGGCDEGEEKVERLSEKTESVRPKSKDRRRGRIAQSIGRSVGREVVGIEQSQRGTSQDLDSFVRTQPTLIKDDLRGGVELSSSRYWYPYWCSW